MRRKHNDHIDTHSISSYHVSMVVVRGQERNEAPYFSGVAILLSLVTTSIIPYKAYVHVVNDKYGTLEEGKSDGKPEHSMIAPGVAILYNNDQIK